jgi:hypothetical protein
MPPISARRPCQTGQRLAGRAKFAIFSSNLTAIQQGPTPLRSKYPGTDADGIAKTEADQRMKFPACSQWFNMWGRRTGSKSRTRQPCDRFASALRPHWFHGIAAAESGADQIWRI